jgi:hypothetical protein
LDLATEKSFFKSRLQSEVVDRGPGGNAALLRRIEQAPRRGFAGSPSSTLSEKHQGEYFAKVQTE